MSEDDPMISSEDVTILPPDKSLYIKIGKPNLDMVFSAEIMQSAQQAIVEAAGSLIDEAKEELAKLKVAASELEKAPQRAAQFLPVIISHAFNTKSRTGLGSYTLVSEISKSLQNYCEGIAPENFSSKDRDIIKWHIQSMEMLVAKNVKGDGGEFGKAIMDEIQRLQTLRRAD